MKMAATDDWACILHAVELSDIREHYGFAKSLEEIVILRALASRIYGEELRRWGF